MQAEAAGFAGKSQSITYQGVPIHMDIELATAAGLTEVVVQADDASPVEPAHVDITQQQIDRMPTESLNSPFSSLVTMTTPGVSADSNGSFHPLGDHAEASFVVDGQPITDQQSRTFSTQFAQRSAIGGGA